MPDDPKDDAHEGLRKLLEKHSNDATALATQLYSDNYQLREDKRKLKEQLADAEKAKPAEGSVVLSKADAERWKAYQELGKPDDLKATVTERDTLKGEVAKAIRTETIRSVAEVAGYNADVLGELAKETQTFAVKEITVDGKTIKQAYIVVEADGKQVEKPLAEFAEANWKSFLPALQPTVTPEKRQRQGTPYVPQKQGAPPQPPDQVAAERARLASTGDYSF